MIKRNPDSDLIDNKIVVTIEIGQEGLNINDFPFNHTQIKEAAQKAGIDAGMEEARRQLRQMRDDGTLEEMYGSGFRIEGL